MKKVIFNFSNLEKGGGAQISLWLIKKINEELDDLDFTPIYYLSKSLFIKADNLNLLHNEYYVFDKSPVRSRKDRMLAKKISKDSEADLVFTLFGPSGVSFDCYEISGVANAWIASVTISDFFKYNNFILAPIQMLKYYLLGLSLNKKDYLVFETDSSRRDFIERFSFPKNKTSVIPNSINDYFLRYEFSKVDKLLLKGKLKLLYVSTYYPHKNFELIPRYIKELKESSCLKIEVSVTLSDDEFSRVIKLAEKYDVVDCIVNLGYVSPEKLPELYENTDVVFSPSSIENFSATYVEAIYAQRPLLIADRVFSRSICGDYATYFNPYDTKDFCEKIESIANSLYSSSWTERSQVHNIELPNSKFDKIIECINKI